MEQLGHSQIALTANTRPHLPGAHEEARRDDGQLPQLN
jgi:hypothetical protein